jgi:hypothetical protein
MGMRGEKSEKRGDPSNRRCSRSLNPLKEANRQDAKRTASSQMRSSELGIADGAIGRALPAKQNEPCEQRGRPCDPAVTLRPRFGICLANPSSKNCLNCIELKCTYPEAPTVLVRLMPVFGIHKCSAVRSSGLQVSTHMHEKLRVGLTPCETGFFKRFPARINRGWQESAGSSGLRAVIHASLQDRA